MSIWLLIKSSSNTNVFGLTRLIYNPKDNANLKFSCYILRIEIICWRSPHTFAVGMGDSFFCQISKKCVKIIEWRSSYYVSTFSCFRNLLEEAATSGWYFGFCQSNPRFLCFSLCFSVFLIFFFFFFSFFWLPYRIENFKIVVESDEDKELAKLLTGYQDMVGLLSVHKVARINTQVFLVY